MIMIILNTDNFLRMYFIIRWDLMVASTQGYNESGGYEREEIPDTPKKYWTGTSPSDAI